MGEEDKIPGLLQAEVRLQQADGYHIAEIYPDAVLMIKRVKPTWSQMLFHAVLCAFGAWPIYLIRFMHIYSFFRGAEYRLIVIEQDGEPEIRMA